MPHQLPKLVLLRPARKLRIRSVELWIGIKARTCTGKSLDSPGLPPLGRDAHPCSRTLRRVEAAGNRFRISRESGSHREFWVCRHLGPENARRRRRLGRHHLENKVSKEDEFLEERYSCQKISYRSSQFLFRTHQ